MARFQKVSENKMIADNELFDRFLEAEDTLWVCQAGDVLFRSREKGIAPLLSYIRTFAPHPKGVTVCDRVVGNAAALLLKKVFCTRVYGVRGSQLAAETLNRLGITYSFLTEVPYIVNRAGDGMCPFEKASVGKSPDEFYQFVEKGL